MPIYEYECRKCGEVFEVNQPMSAEPLKRHGSPKQCGGKVVKLVSMSSFQLKGGGWFKDGYSGASNKKDEPVKKSETKMEKPKADKKANKTETGKKAKSTV